MTGRIVVVNGLPGAGKSTLARALAAGMGRAAVVEGDYLQHTMTASGLVGPGDEPAAESWRQLELRWRNIAALSGNFLAAGFDVVVDSLLIPRLARILVDALPDADYHYLHLDPRAGVRRDRDAARGYKRIGDQFDYIESEFAPLLGRGAWLDSSDWDVATTVAAARRALADGSAQVRGTDLGAVG